MLCIENRLRAEGITDIIDLSDSMTQSQEEAQFNVFVADAAEPPSVTPTPTATELVTATATETPTSVPSATPIRTVDIVPDCRVDALDLMSLIDAGRAEDDLAEVLFDFARCWRASCGEGP